MEICFRGFVGTSCHATVNVYRRLGLSHNHTILSSERQTILDAWSVQKRVDLAEERMSAPELETDQYDVVIIGTGLAESIAAA